MTLLFDVCFVFYGIDLAEPPQMVNLFGCKRPVITKRFFINNPIFRVASTDRLAKIRC